jgi:hypothetical protein
VDRRESAAVKSLTPIALGSVGSYKMTTFHNSYFCAQTAESAIKSATFYWCDSFPRRTERFQFSSRQKCLIKRKCHSAEPRPDRSNFVLGDFQKLGLVNISQCLEFPHYRVFQEIASLISVKIPLQCDEKMSETH